MSLVQNYVHIVFSTKYRTPWIKPTIEEELHKYMAEMAYQYDSPPVIIGGYTDHIHILCSLSKKYALMTVVQKIKAYSSKWIKTKGKEYENFFWQTGYGAFSVNYNRLEIVRNYIRSQHEHHKNKNYKEEFGGLMRKNNIDFDERYVWD